MSSNRQPSKRLSREQRQGFSLLPTHYDHSKTNSNPATVEIPMEQVQSGGSGNSGLRNQNSIAQLRPSGSEDSQANEKRHLFPRGRRHRPEPSAAKTGKIGYDGEEDTLTTMGKIYKKIANFSVATRYLLYVAPLAIVIAIPMIIGATVAKGANIAGVRMVWFFMWVEVIWLSLWVSKTFCHYLPKLFQLVAGVVSSSVRKYALVLKALEIPLSLVFWALTSLATFVPVMTHNPTAWRHHDDWCNSAGICTKEIRNGTRVEVPDPLNTTEWMRVVQKILAAALISTIVYALEKTIVQLISINYHRKQFNARIKSSKHNVYLLSLLYDASRALFPAYCNEFAEEDYAIADQLNISFGPSSKRRSRGNGTGTSNKHSGSATPMRIVQNIGRYGDQITSMFGHVAQEVTGKDVFNPNSAHSIVSIALDKKRTSEALARRLWMSFVVEGHDALYYDDVAEVLGPDRRQEAEEAFYALDRDGNGDISLDEMILTVSEMSRDRKAIASSMHDVDQAINVLDKLLCAVVFVAVILIFVAFLNKSFTTTLATTGTALLSLSFVFATTAQEVLGSCIFLFVKHPFDIGDRVDINTDQMVVEHISLLFTVFRRVTGQYVGRSVQVPNIVLNALWIENVSRSGPMTEQLTVNVAYDTSFDDLQILKHELQNFVTDKDNSRDFQPDIGVQVIDTSDMSKMGLQIEVKHKSNWSNETIRAARRSKFMCALIAALRAVPINAPGGGSDAAGSAANPSYSVAISDAEAKKNAEASAKAKEEARLVPNKKLDDEKSKLSPISSGRSAMFSSRDQQIVSNLTNPNPAVDPVRDEAWTSSRDDGSTLGERPSIDRGDLNEMRTLLRRESTRGKRKAGETGHYNATMPIINEPQQTVTTDYIQPQQHGGAPIAPVPSPYTTASQRTHPAYSSQPPQIPPPQLPSPSAYPVSPIEMTQVPSRSASNPYRQRAESASRKPLSPPPRAPPKDRDGEEGEDDGYGNMRPYSGV